MRNWLVISLLLLCACSGCTRLSERLVLIPNDHDLQPVYDGAGKIVEGRSSISDGWLRELEQDLDACAKVRP